MPGEPTIVHQRLSSIGAELGYDGLLRLPPEAVERARRRMGTLAGVFATAFVIGITYNELAHAAGVLPVEIARPRLTNGAGLVTSLAMFAVARARGVSDHQVLLAGLAFLVQVAAVTMGINLYLASEGPISAMTWAIPVIILYPLVIPTPPRVTATVCFAVGALVGVSAWGLSLAGALVPIPAGELFLFTFNHGLGAVVAVAASSLVHQLNVEAAEGRMLGAYQLDEVLGRGGMGEVWRGTHRLLARPAAVKVVRPELLGEMSAARRAEVMERFTREAKATSGLTSPHTVELYDFGSAEDGSCFYVMELLDGVDLQSFVEQYGPMEPARVVRVLHQVCASLAEAHARGLVHRDLKPANVVLATKGVRRDFAVVLDFGLVALRADVAPRETRLTREGFVGGTPAYLAPEQALGEAVDGRTDLYALGCVGWWLLTGRRVFEGEAAMELVAKHLKDTPEAPSVYAEQPVPEALDALLLELLAKDPDARPANALEVQARLRAIPLEPWTDERAERWWRTHLGAASMW